MKAKVLSLIMCLFLTVVPQQKSQALVSLVVAPYAAVFGLAAAPVLDLEKFWGLWVLLLDEEGQKVSFKTLTAKDASELGITDSQKKSFNNELEEMNILLELVVSDVYNEEITDKDEILSVWEGYLSEDASEGAANTVRAILSKTFNK
jgi:hypothetical protein